MLTAENVRKVYRRHAVSVPVLRGVNLSVAKGEFVSVIGASGSGKSTLLHLLGTLDRPDEGQICLDGQRIDDLPPRSRDRLRNQTFGMIFQFYHLLPELSTIENVMMPAMISKSLLGWLWSGRAVRRRATELLERVGLSHRLRHKPRELSGGEMQRTALARALISQPRVLLADEPTGNLDADSGREVMRILRGLNRDEGVTVLMVTHNAELIAPTDRVIRLVSGQIESVQTPLAACG